MWFSNCDLLYFAAVPIFGNLTSQSSTERIHTPKDAVDDDVDTYAETGKQSTSSIQITN